MADEQSPMEFDEEKVPEVLPILPLYEHQCFESQNGQDPR